MSQKTLIQVLSKADITELQAQCYSVLGDFSDPRFTGAQPAPMPQTRESIPITKNTIGYTIGPSSTFDLQKFARMVEEAVLRKLETSSPVLGGENEST